MKEVGSTFFGAESVDDLPFAKADELVTAVVDANDYVDAKMAAMAAHATQIELDGPFFALSNQLGLQVWGHEFYSLAQGNPSEPFNGDGRETDLFAGIVL
jgi:N-acetyl-1-D-myo-inositol-2-amino-2-deoxy-alpha-D-glucopyranoside deacetylase